MIRRGKKWRGQTRTHGSKLKHVVAQKFAVVSGPNPNDAVLESERGAGIRKSSRGGGRELTPLLHRRRRVKLKRLIKTEALGTFRGNKRGGYLIRAKAMVDARANGDQ